MPLGPKRPSKAALASRAQLSAMTHLRKMPERMSMQPSKAFSGSKRGLLHLGQEMAGPLDWAGDQVREQADEQGVVEQEPAGSSLPLVDVDDVGDLLKGVEGDRRREDDLPERVRKLVKAGETAKPAKESTKKLKYLKKPRKPKFNASEPARKMRLVSRTVEVCRRRAAQ